MNVFAPASIGNVSVGFDALGLALGDRADPRSVGPNGDKAEIIASFDVSDNTPAQRWLEARELGQEDSCLLRRVISREGKSRAFINGNSCTPGSVLKLLIMIKKLTARKIATLVPTRAPSPNGGRRFSRKRMNVGTNST